MHFKGCHAYYNPLINLLGTNMPIQLGLLASYILPSHAKRNQVTFLVNLSYHLKIDKCEDS